MVEERLDYQDGISGDFFNDGSNNNKMDVKMTMYWMRQKSFVQYDHTHTKRDGDSRATGMTCTMKKNTNDYNE